MPICTPGWPSVIAQRRSAEPVTGAYGVRRPFLVEGPADLHPRLSFEMSSLDSVSSQLGSYLLRGNAPYKVTEY
jgi:hypothetical protein